MKRNYLLVPGQRIQLRIDGDTGVGKTGLAEKIIAMVQADGLLAAHIDGLGFNDIVITCPTPAEARQIYLDTLDGHQRETLRAHLDALGYEL